MKRTILFLTLAICFAGCNKIATETTNSPSQTWKEESASTSAATDFSIVVMPDTQHYMAGFFGGTVAMFNSQITWIKNNKTARNIVYVAGVGDIVEHGDNPSFAGEWTNAADNGYYKLETSGIPYGLAVGNHDQGADPYSDWGRPLLSPTNKYNAKFGISHFNNASHSYWKGNYGTNNDSHYDFFTAAGVDFMVIYIEFDSWNDDRQNMADWAKNLCLANPSRKAIIVSHYMTGNGTQIYGGGAFGAQGQGLYNTLKVCPNVFMFLGGHISGAGLNEGEGYREDTYNGRTIRTYMSDYQARTKGGNGLLRIMKFSVANDDVTVKTYSPFTNSYETDVSSQFTRPLFGAAPTVQVANGTYKIIARHSGKALVVTGGVATDGAGIAQYDYQPTHISNRWNLTQIGTTGYYRISNANSGKDMHVGAASAASGQLVVQWPYPAGPETNDEWGLIPVAGGYYKIINRHSGLALKIKNGSLTAGDPLIQSDYDAQTSAQFQILAP